MKRLSKSLPLLLLAAFVAVSCGKKDNSSGSPSNPVNSTVVSATGTAYSTIDEVRSRFASMPFSTSVVSGTEIIHAGSMYANGSGSSNTLDLGIIELNFNVNISSGSQTDIMRVLRVNSASNDSVNVTKATGSNYGIFTYENSTPFDISRSGTEYQKMLGLQNGQCSNIHVETATIYIQDVGTSAHGGTQITGNKIYCLNQYNQMKSGYIVSDALPVAANPIYAQDNTTGKFGYLVKSGNTIILNVQ